MKQKAVCFDIDGTLANNCHRQHWVRSKPRNWNAYNKALIYDEPIEEVLEIFHIIKTYYHIFLVTGRSEDLREETIRWLQIRCNIYDYDYNEIYMRKEGDYRDDSIVKMEIADMIEEDYNIFAVFDDRQSVVKAWIDRGIFVFDVSQGKGNF